MRKRRTKSAAVYPGNIGFEEMFKFYDKATPQEQHQMESLLNANKVRDAWELLKRVTRSALIDDGNLPELSGKETKMGESTKLSFEELLNARITSKEGQRFVRELINILEDVLEEAELVPLGGDALSVIRKDRKLADKINEVFTLILEGFADPEYTDIVQAVYRSRGAATACKVGSMILHRAYKVAAKTPRIVTKNKNHPQLPLETDPQRIPPTDQSKDFFNGRGQPNPKWKELPRYRLADWQQTLMEEVMDLVIASYGERFIYQPGAIEEMNEAFDLVVNPGNVDGWHLTKLPKTPTAPKAPVKKKAPPRMGR